MGRFFFGVFMTLLLIVSFCGVLFALDQSGFVDLQTSVITMLAKVPGWQDLPEALTAGKKMLNTWQSKEKVYQAQVEELKNKSKKLKEDLEQVLATIPQSKDDLPSKEAKSDAGKGEPVLPVGTTSVQQASRLLEEMKPQVAAEMLMKIPSERVLDILGKMEPRKAAKIMETMPVENGSVLLIKMTENR
jgi:hypothetical protein